jgi:DNA-binding transcriptional MocR family regulator
VPSYLSVDTDGRVVRLDTFSKTVAPGCRLGWITAQPAIIERILRITESSTQQPSGFVQAMIAELIMGPQSKTDGGRGGTKNGSGWKVDGWVRWLEGLRGVYERRMNRMASILEEGKYHLKQSTPIKKDDDDWAVVTKTQMYDFDWPRGGMFIWLKLTLESHPLWGKVEPEKLAKALWIYLTTKPFLVLATPGATFSPTDELRDAVGWSYFRLCFAAVSEDEIDASSHRFVAGVNSFWRIKKVEELEGIIHTVEVDPEECTDMGLNFTC